MDCAEFEERWLEALDEGDEGREGARSGRGGGPGRESLTEHLAGCRRCREFVALLDQQAGAGSGDTAASGAGPPGDLVASVLARTSGPACDRVGRLLAGRLDAERGHPDPLLRTHLEGCPDCATLARVLEAMGPELAALAEIEPDRGFVADVMAATVSAPPAPAGAAPEQTPEQMPEQTPQQAPPGPSPSVWNRPVGGLIRDLATLPRVRAFRDWLVSRPAWGRLARRPRLALEGAFVATLVVVLLVGVPSGAASAASELPGRVLARVHQERVEVTEGVRQLTAANLGELSTAVQRRWEATSRRLDTYFDDFEISARDVPVLRRWVEGREGQDGWVGDLLQVVEELWARLRAFMDRIGVAAGDILGPDDEPDAG